MTTLTSIIQNNGSDFILKTIAAGFFFVGLPYLAYNNSQAMDKQEQQSRANSIVHINLSLPYPPNLTNIQK